MDAWRKPFVLALTSTAAGSVPGAHALVGRPASPETLAELVGRFRELVAGLDGFAPVI